MTTATLSNIDGLKKDLETDKVITLEQAKRYYDATETELKAAPLFLRTVHVAPTKRSREMRVTFVSLDQRTLRSNPATLRHLSQTAEIRLSMKIPPAEWTSTAGEHSLENPDALWISDASRVPVEIDVGTYSKKRIKTKLLAYHEKYGRQIWGTPSPKRAEYISGLAESMGIPEVYTVQIRFP